MRGVDAVLVFFLVSGEWRPVLGAFVEVDRDPRSYRGPADDRLLFFSAGPITAAIKKQAKPTNSIKATDSNESTT